MIRTLPALLLAAVSLPASAQVDSPRLDLEQRMLLRCSAAFAIVSWAQENANEDALRYPRDEAAYREFFARAAAQVMDEAGLGEDEIEAALETEARDLLAQDTLDAVMPPCLTLLKQG